MKNKCHIGWKTLSEKEKLLIPSNFSFLHNVFHSYISLVHQNAALSGNGLKLSQNNVLDIFPQTKTTLFNNPCFSCNIAITNFLVSHTCKIRFHDVIGQNTVPMFTS